MACPMDHHKLIPRGSPCLIIACCWRVASRIAFSPWFRIMNQAERMTSGSGSISVFFFVMCRDCELAHHVLHC